MEPFVFDACVGSVRVPKTTLVPFLELTIGRQRSVVEKSHINHQILYTIEYSNWTSHSDNIILKICLNVDFHSHYFLTAFLEHTSIDRIIFYLISSQYWTFKKPLTCHRKSLNATIYACCTGSFRLVFAFCVENAAPVQKYQAFAAVTDPKNI